MRQKAMWIYPWDLMEVNIDDVVSHLAEEIGINTLSLATAYHSVEHLRPLANGEKVFRSPKASLYFQPRSDFYRQTRLEPNIHSLVQDVSILPRFVSSCRSNGIKPKSWTVYLHNSYLGTQYPDCVQQNVYGDHYTYALCPANPDVRAYAIALSEALQNQGMEIIEIESLSYMGFGHAHYHSKLGVDFGGAKPLFDLCFCTACRQRSQQANIDVPSLMANVRKALDLVLSQGRTDLSWDDYLSQITNLTDYIQMQEQVVQSLLLEISETVNCELNFILMGTGLNAPKIAEISDKVEILAYTANPAQVTRVVESRMKELTSVDQLVVGYSVYGASTPNAETLEQTVGAAIEIGVKHFSFYNYGIMPPSHLAWLKQAIQQIDAVGIYP